MINEMKSTAIPSPPYNNGSDIDLFLAPFSLFSVDPIHLHYFDMMYSGLEDFYFIIDLLELFD